MATPETNRSMTIRPPIFRRIQNALSDGTISGAGAQDQAGVFPLRLFDPSIGSSERVLRDQWARHVESVAVATGQTQGLAAGLVGALGELQDNCRPPLPDREPLCRLNPLQNPGPALRVTRHP